MTHERVRALGTKGGKKSHRLGRAHKYTSRRGQPRRQEKRGDPEKEEVRSGDGRVAGPHHDCPLHGRYFGETCLECDEESEG